MTQLAGIFAVEKHNVSGLIIVCVCSWVAGITVNTLRTNHPYYY